MIAKAASATIINEENKILIQDHVKTGKLSIPVGSVEPFETAMAAIKRELFEELGVEQCVIGRCLKIHQWAIKVEEYNFKVNLIDEWFNKEPHKHTWIKFMSLKEILATGRPMTECLKSALKDVYGYVA